MTKFKLPEQLAHLVRARNAVRDHYTKALTAQGCDVELNFTLDGNLVGDIGEAVAVEMFGVELTNSRSSEGIDGYLPIGGKSVQVKATGTGRGPAFRATRMKADYLLFFELDFEKCTGEVVFNGPEHYARAKLPKDFEYQRSLSRTQIREAAKLVPLGEQIPLIRA